MDKEEFGRVVVFLVTRGLFLSISIIVVTLYIAISMVTN